MFIFTVPQNHCSVIEMFGKPVSVKKSGLNFYIPFLQKIKRVDWMQTHTDGKYIQLSEQLLDTAPRSCVTKDNATLDVSCIIRWRITDAKQALYEVENLHRAILELVLNELRALIGNRNLDELLSSRAQLSEKVVQAISGTTARWGISVNSVEIQELSADSKTQDAMLKQMEAERVSRAIALEAEGKSRAIRLNAEAEKDAAIMRAEATKAAMQLIAEAEAEYVAKLAQTIGAEGATKALLNRQALDSYKTITANPSDKVFLPANVPAMVNIKD